MHLNFLQILVLSLLQGLTELFPISSLGHTVILPALLGWGRIETDTSCGGQSCFLPLIVALHLGTSIALVIYFWRDWIQVAQTLFNSVKEGEVRKGTQEWVSWLIIIGSIPAGVLGVFLQEPLQKLFASPLYVSAFLIVNGSLLFAGERMRRRAELRMQQSTTAKEREAHFRPLSSLSWKEAIVVGLAQSLALIPGFSRSGATMVAGLGVRLNHEDAARFSFLLGTPIIFAAGALEVPALFTQPPPILLMIFAGMVVCGVTAFLSTKFLMKYFETGRLDPFAYYCWAAGLISILLLVFVQHIQP
jgi:undecaprenyl-diphosphatase